jgi:predicted secreted protein
MRIIVLAIALLLGIGAVHAGDRHLIGTLAYSADDSHFAFEEFGSDLGDANLPMSQISIIDVAADAEIPGSPFLAMGLEGGSLVKLRAKAAALAAPHLARHGVDLPGQIVSMAGEGVAGANPNALRFGQPQSGYSFDVDDDRLLTLSVFETRESDRPICEETGLRPRGFSLSVAAGGGAPREVYRDQRVAKSRGCVLDNRLYAVVLPLDNDMSKAIALVSVLTAGFEGYDRRFVAVPIGK